MTQAAFTDAPALVLTGTGSKPRRAQLRGARAVVTGRVTKRGDTWTATLPLRHAKWGGDPLPLPTGTYEVRLEPGDDVPVAEPEETIDSTVLPGLRAGLNGWTLDVRPPVNPAYDSGEGQDALERRYATRPGGVEDAVFFESYYGRNASGNPLAIDRELARRVPSLTRYWSVVDLSVAVPPGAIALVEGSPEWWRARGSARLLVINDWLRRRFARRPGQIVLQTWHGTPLKKLALHRPGINPRRSIAVRREARRWDVLLAQNLYAERVFRSAYALRRRPVWVEGYPRNDILVTGDGGATRKALGIAADQKVLLYAPTWRDDQETMVDFLDASALADATGAIVLVRGHTRTLAQGADIAGDRVIDVTTFPDVSALMVAADALITDYSSVMFDFGVTGKPMYFFAPDLDHYRGNLRGLYFDISARAPGPMVTSQADLTDAITAGKLDLFHDRYQWWRGMFNAFDDGHASERVVTRILDQGWVAG